MLLSDASPIGNFLLITLHNTQCWLSTFLLISHPQLSILLLVEIAGVRFLLAFRDSTNSHSSHFQLPINIQTHQKPVAVRLLPTALFRDPKNVFSTIKM
jgi:hypothetical protein